MKSHLVISLTKSKYRKSFNLDLWILNPILSRSNGQTIKRGSQSKPTGNHPHGAEITMQWHQLDITEILQLIQRQPSSKYILIHKGSNDDCLHHRSDQ